jgi:hypothetical protein
VSNYLLNEDGSILLQEDGFALLVDFEEIPWSTGHVHIGRFVPGDPKYTIQNEVTSYAQISEDRTRANIAKIDGNLDSWTEYDRDDLTIRDSAIVSYLDLPELKSSGEVRQRAIEELRAARRVNSPGGSVAWQPWFTQKDSIYWVDEDQQKYTATIEGLSVEWSQGEEPFQRAEIDTGNVIICDENIDPSDYFARDLFERTTVASLGDAVTGGTWVIYDL